MFFKPRIFVSSLMKDKLELRAKIEKTLTEAGAECMLYEKNLTPSTDKNTYRNDIVDSDFIILILDENYGAKTDLGLSGTEEEYEIAISNKKKIHIYLKKTDKQELSQEQQNFISKIQASGASFYYYKNEKDLLKRIKSSLFTVANNISLNNLSFDRLNFNEVLRKTFDLDYKIATDIIAANNEMLSLIKFQGYDILNSSLFFDFTAPFIDGIERGYIRFIDCKIFDLLENAYINAKTFHSQYQLLFTSTGMFRNYISPVLGPIIISDSRLCNPQTDTRPLIDLYQNYLSAFNVFVDYIEKKKLGIDCIKD